MALQPGMKRAMPLYRRASSSCLKTILFLKVAASGERMHLLSSRFARNPHNLFIKEEQLYRKHPRITNESREASMPSIVDIGLKHAGAQKFQADCARRGTSIGWGWFRLLIM